MLFALARWLAQRAVKSGASTTPCSSKKPPAKGTTNLNGYMGNGSALNVCSRMPSESWPGKSMNPQRLWVLLLLAALIGLFIANTATAVLTHVVRSIVDDPSLVIVDGAESRGRVRLEVRVGPGDLGRVIGRRGRTAQSIRTVVRAAATRDDVEVDVDFAD